MMMATFSHSGKYLAVLIDGAKVVVLNADDRFSVWYLFSHHNNVTCIAFAHNDAFVITGGEVGVLE